MTHRTAVPLFYDAHILDAGIRPARPLVQHAAPVENELLDLTQPNGSELPADALLCIFTGSIIPAVNDEIGWWRLP